MAIWVFRGHTHTRMLRGCRDLGSGSAETTLCGLIRDVSSRSPQARLALTHLLVSPLSQGPLDLSFKEDPQERPLELALQRVSIEAKSAQEKVSRNTGDAAGTRGWGDTWSLQPAGKDPGGTWG